MNAPLPAPAPAGRHRDWPWLLALAGLAGLIAALPAARGRTVVDAPEVLDLGNQWLGFAAFIRDSYLHGRFPLWDPHDLCGMPFLAFAHTGSLYLPGVAAHLLTASYPLAGALDIFLHLALAAVGAFALFRVAGRSQPAAFAGAVAYAFAGFIFANLNFPPSLHTGAWLPIWFAAGFALLKRPRLPAFLIAAIALAAMILAGDLEMTVYAILGFGFEVVLRSRERNLARASLAALAAAGALGLALALPLGVPALEFQHLSVRAGETFLPEVGIAVMAVIPLYALFPLPTPALYYPPNHGLDPWYLGAVFILLAGDSLRSAYARRRLLIFPAAALYVIFFYAPPFSRLTAHVPILGGLLVPFRLWPTLEIFFLLAATSALDQWLAPARGPETDRGNPAGPLGRAGGFFLAGFGVATIVSLFWIHYAAAPRLVFGVFILATGVTALLGFFRARPLSLRARTALALGLILLDLYGLALAWEPRTDPARLAPDPRLTPILADSSGQARYLILSGLGIIDSALPYHLGLRLHADTIDAFTRVPPRAAALRLARLYPALLRRDAAGRLVQYDQMAVRDPRNLDPRELNLLSRMNVTVIVSRFPWSPPAPFMLEPILIQPDLYVYRNLDALAEFRAHRELGGKFLPVNVSARAPDEVKLSALQSPADFAAGDFTLADSWYPGWRAWAGDRELKISADDLGFRRVSGAADVTMRFLPLSFRLGLFSGLASALALLLAAGCGFLGRKDRIY